MQPVKILTDSTCDLSPELLARYGVRTIPLYVTLGNKSLKDGITITPRMIYDEHERTKKTPKTSACSTLDFYEFFKPTLEAGYDVVFIGISEQMSSTVQNARVVAQELGMNHIHCVDSKSLSTGIGLQVIKAAEMAQRGATAGQIVANLEAMRGRVHASFVVDDVNFLYHGGRCTAVQAIGASIFSLKPQIAVEDGRMVPGEKIRGSFQRVAKLYAENELREPSRMDSERVFITYSKDTDEDVVATVRAVVDATGHFREILQTEAGCVITSHCGRNTIGVLYVEKAE